MGLGKHVVLSVGACAALVAAPATAGCWQDGEVAGARVRQLQTMLMVATLKCRAAGIDISADYNAFVRARMAAIDTANGAIKRHFAAVGGQVAYDRFATVLANGYSHGATSAETCADAAKLAGEAGAAAELTRIAEERVAPRELPEGACAKPQVAAALPAPLIEAPAAAQVTLVSATSTSAATPLAEGGLPPQVLAAMAVLADYARDHGQAIGAAASAR